MDTAILCNNKTCGIKDHTTKDIEHSFILEKSILEKTIGELQEDTEDKDRHMKKLKDDMDKFMEDALKSEEEICELLTAQKQTTMEAETQIIELQKVIKQLQNKSTSTTSTQTTLCKTTKETSIQTTTDTKNTFSQTECNGADGEETENYDNIKETKSEITTTVKSTQCNIAEIPHEGREKPSLKITCKRKWNPKKNHRITQGSLQKQAN
ncbi:hypothetical protein JTB14_002859 [Gonioctena quinquepunctata]|nr:hypothetical protein JTB14_002859 [Gonioctena quinquepunctata]